jgi:hypothetical protein
MRVRCQAPGCPEKRPRRRMMPVLIIAGELAWAARSDPRETWHPAALDGTSSVRAPHVAKGRYRGVSLDATPKAVANVGVAIPDQVSVSLHRRARAGLAGGCGGPQCLLSFLE